MVRLPWNRPDTDNAPSTTNRTSRGRKGGRLFILPTIGNYTWTSRNATNANRTIRTSRTLASKAGAVSTAAIKEIPAKEGSAIRLDKGKTANKNMTGAGISLDRIAATRTPIRSVGRAPNAETYRVS